MSPRARGAPRRAPLAALCALAACSFEAGQLTVASTAKLPIAVREIHIVEGRDCARMALGIPIGAVVPSLGRAVSQALAQIPEADTLVKTSIYREDFNYVLFQRTCLYVKGMAASTSAAHPSADPVGAQAPAPDAASP